jgi:hypothetical protein
MANEADAYRIYRYGGKMGLYDKRQKPKLTKQNNKWYILCDKQKAALVDSMSQ